MLTLVTMAQGNPIALKRTLDSFKLYVSEVIFGDLLIFEEDRQLIKTYCEEYNMKMVYMPFNTIFLAGFARVLNLLASCATNDHCLYMNVSEIMDPNVEQKLVMDENVDAHYLIHAVETHHWYRMFNRKKVQWRGLIHEEVHPIAEFATYAQEPSFQFADTEKDMADPFKAKVYNDVKELIYFNMYLQLVEKPYLIDVTNEGWVNYAKDGYESLKSRIEAKGQRYHAFKCGDLDMYLHDIRTNPEFEAERFESSKLVNLQGLRKDIL